MKWPWQKVADPDPEHAAASTRTLDRLDAIADRLEVLRDDLRRVIAEERGDRP